MANTHDYGERSLHMHYEKRGKIEIVPTVPVKTSEDLSLAYTPGVATPCLAIQKEDLAILVLRLVCRLWKESVYCLRHSVM